jgi:hypothetical protein
MHGVSKLTAVLLFSQTGFFSTPDACGSYDYNCDGVETLKVTNQNTSCTVVSSTACGCDMCACDAKNVCGTSCVYYPSANPPCGSSNTFGYDSLTNQMGLCTPNYGGNTAGPQSCH